MTQHVAQQLLNERLPNTFLLVVGGRVTQDARNLLLADRAGYLDLRGRLAIRSERLVIDAQIESVTERPARTSALAGKAGIEVAVAVLMDPARPHAVRELARALGRSPSTVSEVLAAFRHEGFVDERNVLSDSRLFWSVAEHWCPAVTPLATVPRPGDAALATALRLGMNDLDEPGWALGDSAAAAAYGAPLAYRSGQTLDFYVPDQSVARRAATLLGAAGAGTEARATVRVAPVAAIVNRRVNLSTHPHGWPLAHPLFVALDLATDQGRGREIIASWTPDNRWTRVW